MGVLIDIITLNVPGTAAARQSVNVSVSVRNQAPGVFTYIAVTGLYDNTEYSLSPLYHEVYPGVTVSFAGTFTMPDKDTRVYVYAFFWNGSRWVPDDEDYADVKLSEVPEYKRLVVNRKPTAGGAVTSSLSPVTGTVYDGYYAKGTTVYVTAHPNPGYTFKSWSGELTDTTNLTAPVYMTENRTITAHFELEEEEEPDVETLEVDITPVGKGHVTTDPASEEGKTTWYDDDTGTFPYGTYVQVTAHPSSGYVFDHWSDEIVGGVSYDNPAYVQEMTERRSVKAHFREEDEPDTETLEVDITPTGRGYVVTDPASEEGKTNFTHNETGQFVRGTSVKVTAFPGEGYIFEKWTDQIVGGVSYENPDYVQVMDQRRTVKCHFMEGEEPEFQLIQDYTYPYAAGYAGSVEECTFKFSLTPDEIPGTDWFKNQVVNAFTDEVEKQGAKMIKLQVYEDTTPALVTNYKIIATSTASPVPWALIIVGVLGILFFLALSYTIIQVRTFLWGEEGPPSGFGDIMMVVVMMVVMMMVMGFVEEPEKLERVVAVGKRIWRGEPPSD